MGTREVQAALEPQVGGLSDGWPLEDIAMMSAAISLKRITDSLEKISTVGSEAGMAFLEGFVDSIRKQHKRDSDERSPDGTESPSGFDEEIGF